MVDIPIPPVPPLAVGGHGAAGGYQFRPDEIQGVINDWKTLAAGFSDDIDKANIIANVQAPAADFASDDYITKGTGPSGQALLAQRTAMFTYAQRLIAALEKAAGTVTTAEGDARRDIGRPVEGF